MVGLDLSGLGGRAGDQTSRRVHGQPGRKTTERINSRLVAKREIGSRDVVFQLPTFPAYDEPVRSQRGQRQGQASGGATEGNGHLLQRPGVIDLTVKHLKFPIALGTLAPEVGRHKGPIQIHRIVVEPGASQDRADSAG